MAKATPAVGRAKRRRTAGSMMDRVEANDDNNHTRRRRRRGRRRSPLPCVCVCSSGVLCEMQQEDDDDDAGISLALEKAPQQATSRTPTPQSPRSQARPRRRRPVEGMCRSRGGHGQALEQCKMRWPARELSREAEEVPKTQGLFSANMPETAPSIPCWTSVQQSCS